MNLSRSYFQYRPQKKEDGAVVAEILKIKEKHPRFGTPRITAMLRRKKLVVNPKRVYRITKTLKLLVPRKRRRRKIYAPPTAKFAEAQRSNEVWAMDFISDRTQSGTAFRCFTIVDTYSRVSPAIHVSTSMAEFTVMKVLNSLKAKVSLPRSIILDNGPEFANHTLIAWSRENKISLQFIDPGTPVQNAFIESFNGRLRDECLNQNQFQSVSHAQLVIGRWLKHYNEERLHSSLDYLTPKEFAAQEKLVIEKQEIPHPKRMDLKTG